MTGLTLPVHRRADLLGRLSQGLSFFFYFIEVVAVFVLFELFDVRFNLAAVGRRDFVAGVAQGFLGGVNQRIGEVARFNQLFLLPVFGGVRLGFFAHFLHFVFRQT